MQSTVICTLSNLKQSKIDVKTPISITGSVKPHTTSHHSDADFKFRVDLMDNIANANAKDVWRQSSPWFIIQSIEKSQTFFRNQTENAVKSNLVQKLSEKMYANHL